MDPHSGGFGMVLRDLKLLSNIIEQAPFEVRFMAMASCTCTQLRTAVDQVFPSRERRCVLVLGSTGVGKSTYVQSFRHIQGRTVDGLLSLDLVACGGAFSYNAWKLPHGVGAPLGAIMMFDVTSRLSYSKIPSWYMDLSRVHGQIPTVLVGNKADMKDRKVVARQVTFHKEKHLRYYEISCRCGYQLAKPLEWILAQAGATDLSLLVHCFMRAGSVSELLGAVPDRITNAAPD